ncbi:MAG TPA: hypothetical protein VK826_20115 [Bacteroidia bacterium]|nr:hypothetical protein [Bacteroidia bacterium]
MKRIFQRGKCLSLETMRMYNEGSLPSKSTHEVEKHLLECSLCASAIDGLNARRISDVSKVSTNINKRLAVYMNTPPETPILSRFGMAMIVSSVVLAIGLTVWLIAANSGAPENQLADTGAVTQYDPPSNKNSSQVIPENSEERSQENGAVSVIGNPNGAGEKQKLSNPALANLPATQPGDEKSLVVDPEVTNPNKQEPPKPEDNTRVVATDQFLRIKSVMVYPPTTHSDKKPKSNDNGNNGQINRSNNTKGEFELDEMPTYPGGNEALKNYILANFKPQQEDKDNLKRKTTGVMFQVNAKTGEVTGASLTFPVSPLTDAELLRVIQAMPNWNPGKKRGTVDVILGITFE